MGVVGGGNGRTVMVGEAREGGEGNNCCWKGIGGIGVVEGNVFVPTVEAVAISLPLFQPTSNFSAELLGENGKDDWF